MRSWFLAVLAVAAILPLIMGCASLERGKVIRDLKAQVEELKEQGADPGAIAELEAKIAELEEAIDSGPLIDTGNPAVNQVLEMGIYAVLGFFGIRTWRGSTGARKGKLK